MSAGEHGTIYDERTRCWIMDPNFKPTRADLAIYDHRQVSDELDCVYEWETPLNLERQQEAGLDIIDRMRFWMAVPFVGWIVANLLSFRLDRITDRLEAELPTSN